MVREVRLSDQANGIDVHVDVWKRYAPLVRGGSKFWVVSGFEAQGGIFSGVHLKLESVRRVISGGVAFATPEKDLGPPAKDGASFVLADEPSKDWLAWAPKIPIAPVRAKPEKQSPPYPARDSEAQ